MCSTFSVPFSLTGSPWKNIGPNRQLAWSSDAAIPNEFVQMESKLMEKMQQRDWFDFWFLKTEKNHCWKGCVSCRRCLKIRTFRDWEGLTSIWRKSAIERKTFFFLCRCCLRSLDLSIDDWSIPLDGSHIPWCPIAVATSGRQLHSSCAEMQRLVRHMSIGRRM